MWKNRLFKNILAFCMTLAVIYMAVICAIWMGYESSKSHDVAVSRSSQMVSGLQEELDRRFLVAASVIEQLARNTQIEAFQRNSDYNAYDLVKTREVLSDSAISFSQTGFQIDVLNDKQGFVVTAEKALPLKEYLKEAGLNADVFEAFYQELLSGGNRSQFAVYPDTVVSRITGREQLVLLYKSYVNFRDPLFYFAVYDKKYLVSDYNLSAGDHLYLTYQDRPVMYFFDASEKDGLLEDGQIGTLAGRLGDQPERKPEVYQGQVVNFRKSSAIDGLGVFLAMQKESFWRTNWSVILLLMLATLFALAGGFVLIYMAVRRIYRPVGAVVQEIREHSHSESRDEMQMIHKTFNDFRSSEAEMKRRLEQNQIYLREKFLKDLMYGITIDGSMKEMQARYDLDYLSGNIAVIVVEYVDIEHLKGFLGSNDFNAVKREVLEYLRTDVRFDRFEVFELNESQFSIVTAGYSLEEVCRRMSAVLDVIEVCYDMTLLGAVGNLCGDLSQVRDAFYDALNLLGYKSLFSNRNIVTMAEIGQMNTYYYPMELEKSLMGYIQQGKWENAEKLIGNIVEKNQTLYLDAAMVMELKFALTATLKRCAQLQGQNLDQVFDKERFDEWQRMEEGLEELGQSLLCYFGQICSNAASVREKECSSALRSILDFIHENYMRDISLSDAADRYEISQGYVGKLFRENLQTTFKDYLNQYRIDMAKELLANAPTMKINEVAQRVGFISAVTFNRVFKRYESITPSQYRKAQEM